MLLKKGFMRVRHRKEPYESSAEEASILKYENNRLFCGVLKTNFNTKQTVLNYLNKQTSSQNLANYHVHCR